MRRDEMRRDEWRDTSLRNAERTIKPLRRIRDVRYTQVPTENDDRHWEVYPCEGRGVRARDLE